MKAISELSSQNAVSSRTKSGQAASSKVTKGRRTNHNEEIQMYLSKLKDLVPFMPKNRHVSKLEVIEYVIDYICDLESAVRGYSVPKPYLSTTTSPHLDPNHNSIVSRQPLGILSNLPNHKITTSVTSVTSTTDTITESSSQSPHQITMSDSKGVPVDSRTLAPC